MHHQGNGRAEALPHSVGPEFSTLRVPVRFMTIVLWSTSARFRPSTSDLVINQNCVSHPWAEIRMRGLDSVSTSEAIANMNKM